MSLGSSLRLSRFKKAFSILGFLFCGFSVSSCADRRHTITLQEGEYVLGDNGIYLNGENSESSKRYDFFDSISLRLLSINEETYNQKNGLCCVKDLSRGGSYYSLGLYLQIKNEQSKAIQTTLSPHTNVINESYEFNCHDSYIAEKESFDFNFAFTPWNGQENKCRVSFGYYGSDTGIFDFSATLSKA